MNKVDWWESWLMRKLIDEKVNWWESQLMRKSIDEKVNWWKSWLMVDFRFWSCTYVRMDNTTGCPKKMVILSGFEFLTLGGVFLGVKNNSKNSGTKKNIRLFSKILSKMTLLFSKLSHFLEFSWLCQFQKFKNLLKSQDI